MIEIAVEKFDGHVIVLVADEFEAWNTLKILAQVFLYNKYTRSLVDLFYEKAENLVFGSFSSGQMDVSEEFLRKNLLIGEPIVVDKRHFNSKGRCLKI